MARADVALQQTHTIFDELNQLQRQISDRAYQLFRDRDGAWGDPLNDWLSAERELIWKPAVEVRQKGGQVEIVAALPGVDAKDVDVQVAPHDVLIQADARHEKATGEGDTQVNESEHRLAFQAVHLAERIDPDTAKAEYRDGNLRLTAAVVKAHGPRKIDIQAA